MSTRSITLNAAQIRAVILGLGTVDQDHRTRAAGVVVDALTAAPAPAVADASTADLLGDAQRAVTDLDAERRGLRQTLNELRRDVRRALGPWHADDGAVPDAALVEYVADAVRAAERGRAPVDDEYRRRVGHVLEAAGELADWWTRQEVACSARQRALRDAVEALREYTPAEVAAPAATGGAA